MDLQGLAKQCFFIGIKALDSSLMDIIRNIKQYEKWNREIY